MHIWEKPIFSSLTEPYVWQWLWVCLSLQSKVTIVWLPLLGAMANNQNDLLAFAQMACSQCTELEGTDTNLARAWRAGPSTVTPSHGSQGHRHRHRAGEKMCVPSEMGPTVLALATNSQ